MHSTLDGTTPPGVWKADTGGVTSSKARVVRCSVDSVATPGARRTHPAVGALISLGVALLLPSVADAIPAPGDAEPVDPTVTSNTGAATTRIPIDVPPGPGGFAPNLALTYSSRSGDGPFGVGWSLGISEIRCSARFGVPDLSACTDYELGHQLLVKESDTDEYHTFVESFQRITYNAPSWIVEQPDGTKLYFGVSPTHRIAEGGNTARWLLERMVDAFGNAIYLAYDTTTDVGSAYPTLITYGSGASPSTGPRHIAFVYGDRPDHRLVFDAGLRQEITRRLREIQVLGHQQIARRYVLTYDSGGATTRSRLASVQEFGTDCPNPTADPTESCGGLGLPPQTFRYRDASDVAGAKWADDDSYRLPMGAYPPELPHPWNVPVQLPQMFGDLNGDGLPDRLELRPVGALEFTFDTPVSLTVWINTGSGFEGPSEPEGEPTTADEWMQSLQGLTYDKPHVVFKQIPTPTDSVPAGWQNVAPLILSICEISPVTSVSQSLTQDLLPHGLGASATTADDFLASSNPIEGFLEPRSSMTLADLNADGLADIVVSTRVSDLVSHFECDGTPRAQPLVAAVPPVTVVFRNTGSGWVNDAELANGLPPFEELIVKSSYGTILEYAYVGGPLMETSHLVRTPCADRGLRGFDENAMDNGDTEFGPLAFGVCYAPIDLAPQFHDFNGDGLPDLAVLQRDHPDRLWTGEPYGGYSSSYNRAHTVVWIQTPAEATRWKRAPEYDLPSNLGGAPPAPPAGPKGLVFAHIILWHFPQADLFGLPACYPWDAFFQGCAPTTLRLDPGIRFADLNRDGLTDVVWSNSSLGSIGSGVLLNTGRGSSAPSSAWCISSTDPADISHVGGSCPSAAEYVPPDAISEVDQITNLYRARGRLADLNGDGWLDFIKIDTDNPWNWSTASVKAWIFSHDDAPASNSWTREETYDPPVDWYRSTPHPLVANKVCTAGSACDVWPYWVPFEPTFLAIDIDGDGSTDLVGDLHGFLSQTRHGDLLREVQNGRGETVAIEYKSMIGQMEPTLEDLALEEAPPEAAEASDIVLWRGSAVVSRVTVTGPNLAPGAATDYAYAHPRFSPILRSDLGFRLAERTRPDQSVVREVFRQRVGVVGRTAKLEVWKGADRVFERLEDWEVLPGTMPGSHPTVHVGRLRSVRTANQYPGGAEGAVRQQTLSYDDSHGYGFVGAVVDERSTGTLCTELLPEPIDDAKWLVRRVRERSQHAQWNGNPSSPACAGDVVSRSNFTYNESRVASRTDTVQRRDGSDAPTTVTTTFAYDPDNGNLISRTEADATPAARTTAFSYDGDGGFCHPVPDGQNSRSILVGVRDPLGNDVCFEPDQATGVIEKVVSDYTDEPTIRFVLDAFGRIAEERVTPEGGSEFLRTSYAYDDFAGPPVVERFDWVTDPTGLTSIRSATVEDGFGGTWKTVGGTPTGWVGTMVFRDAVANRVRETYPIACDDSTCSTFDGSMETATETTADALGRVTAIDTPDGPPATAAYLAGALPGVVPPRLDPNAPVDLQVTTDPAENVTRRLIDGDRLVRVEECADAGCSSSDRTFYTYEASGEVSTIYDPLSAAPWSVASHYLKYHYDTLGRVWKIDDPDGGTSTTVYDPVGNAVSTTNARGQVTSFEYDGLDRLKKINQPPGQQRDYEITYRTNEFQPEYERILAQNGTLFYRLTFEYDGMGRIWRRTHKFPDKTLLLDFTYDELGRATSIRYPDTETVVRYEHAGAYLERVCEVTSPSLDCDDPTAIAYVDDLQYDTLGRRATVATPAGVRTYSYLETTQRLAKDHFESSTESLYERTLWYANESAPGVFDGVGYFDAIGNILDIVGQSTGSAVDFSATYAYDHRNRLESWQKPGVGGVPDTPTASFKYDELGNLTRHAVGANDPANQVFGQPDGTKPHAVTQQTDLGITYTYDLDGNLASETGSGGARHYGFDTLNRLSCVGTSAGACNTLQVDYTSGGSRIHENYLSSSSAWTPRRYAGDYFTLDGGRADFHVFAFGEPIAYKRKVPVTLRTAGAWGFPGLGFEPPPPFALALLAALGLAALGFLATRREWAPGLRENPALASFSLALVVVLVVPPLPARAGGGGTSVLYRRWILGDHLGSATVILEANPLVPTEPQGGVEREVVYAPFGAIHQDEGSQGMDTETFAGHPREPTTGLHYMQARWQNPQTGTFLSVDPVVPDASDPQSYNAYSYARNSPFRFTDPTGMWWEFVGSFFQDGYVVTIERWMEGTPPSASESSGGSPSGGGPSPGGGMQNGTAGLADLGVMSAPGFGGLGGGGGSPGAAQPSSQSEAPLDQPIFVDPVDMVAGAIAGAIIGGPAGAVGGGLLGGVARGAGRAGIAGVLSSATRTSAERLAAEAAERGLVLSRHAIERLVGRESHVSLSAVERAIARGQQFFDPKNRSIVSVLDRGMASGQSLLVGRNPESGLITTVITGNDLISSRFLPLP